MTPRSCTTPIGRARLAKTSTTKRRAGGAEPQLSLPGIQRNPGVSEGVVSFEHKDGPGTPADLFVYEIASNRVFRVTNTPSFDESLNDVSVLPNGGVRLVWAANDDLAGDHNIYARTLTLPALDTEPPAQPGDILVVDPDVPPVSTAELFRVDPQSGARSVLSNFGTSNPNAVAVEANGNILVTDNAGGTDPSGGTNEWGTLYRISRDPVTGDLVRTVVTDFGVGPNAGHNPSRSPWRRTDTSSCSTGAAARLAFRSPSGPCSCASTPTRVPEQS